MSAYRADDVIERIDQLIAVGATLLQRRRDIPRHGPEYWVNEDDFIECKTWVSSSANALRHAVPTDTYFRADLDGIMSSDGLERGVPWSVMLRMQALLIALRDEARAGLLGSFEDSVVALTFDDFLDHASALHKSNMIKEAGVLASVVLEDALKRIARKNSLDPNDKSLEELIEGLTKVDVFTGVKAKRVKAMAGVRNAALHAEWDKFDARDVGQLIAGTHELIEHYLDGGNA